MIWYYIIDIISSSVCHFGHPFWTPILEAHAKTHRGPLSTSEYHQVNFFNPKWIRDTPPTCPAHFKSAPPCPATFRPTTPQKCHKTLPIHIPYPLFNKSPFFWDDHAPLSSWPRPLWVGHTCFRQAMPLLTKITRLQTQLRTRLRTRKPLSYHQAIPPSYHQVME
jgi:hypothetical protein